MMLEEEPVYMTITDYDFVANSSVLHLTFKGNTTSASISDEAFASYGTNKMARLIAKEIANSDLAESSLEKDYLFNWVYNSLMGYHPDDFNMTTHSQKNPTLTLSSIADSLSMMNKIVKHPVNGGFGSLKTIIMNLNDVQKWSREEIADWIDDLHETGRINAEFQPWEVE